MIPFATALGASLWTFPFLGIYFILKRVLNDPYLLILLKQGMILAIPCLSGYFGYVASGSIPASGTVAFLWLGGFFMTGRILRR